MKKICEYCNKEHDGTYGSGRFCSNKCARKFSNQFVTENGRKNQIRALTSKKSRKLSSETKKKKSKKKINRKKTKVYKHTQILGSIGELRTVQKFLNHDYNVYKPYVDISGVDLVVSKDNKTFKKIQVKSSSGLHNNCAPFKLTHSERTISKNKYTQKSVCYEKEEVDFFALYSDYTDDVYLIENDGAMKNFRIRVNEPDNKKGLQVSKIHTIDEFQIDNVLNKIDENNNINNDNIIDVDYIEIKNDE